MRIILLALLAVLPSLGAYAYTASDYTIRLKFDPSDTLSDPDDIYRIIYATEFHGSNPAGNNLPARLQSCPAKENTGPRASNNSVYDDYTDMAPRPVIMKDGNIVMFAGHFDMHVSVGKAFHTLARDCKSVMLSKKKPDPFSFRNYEWLTSVYSVDGKEIIALVNNDWKLIDIGDEREAARANNCHGAAGANEENCWWSSLALFRSKTGISGAPYSDAGAKWTFVPATGSYGSAQPAVVATTITKQIAPVDSQLKPTRYANQDNISGYYAPTNIMKSPLDGDYYFISKARYPVSHDLGYCLFRARNGSPLASRTSWFMYGKVKGNNPFATYGWTGEQCTFLPISTVTVSGVRTQVNEARHLSYNTVLDRYILLGVKKITGGGAQVFLIVSKEGTLLDWEKEAIPVTTMASSLKSRVGYFNIIDQGPGYLEDLKTLPHAAIMERRNFDITGEEPELLFSRYEISGNKKLRSQVVRLPMTFKKRP